MSMGNDDGFNEGQQVRLRSGSPVLVVEELWRQDDIVSVVWFDGAKCCRDAFHKSALVLVQTP